MTSPTDDRDLEDYLAGGSEISRRYKAISQEQPPRALDRAVLIEAGAASRLAKATLLRARRARWMVPFAAAATLILGVTLFRDAGMNSHMTSRTPAVPVSIERAVEREAKRDVAEEVAAAQAPAAIAEADKQEATKIEPPPLPAAPPAALSYVANEGRAHLGPPQPAEKWLSDLRQRLGEGRKEQVRQELRRFIGLYPAYFQMHPEAAEPFAEVMDPPSQPAEIVIEKSNGQQK